MLRMACPSGIKLSVLTVEKAVRNFDEKKYYGDKILAIVKSPKTIVELINANFGKYMPNEIVVGNMSGSKEKKQIAPGFNVDEYDVDLFKKINEYGFVCYYQLLPSNNKEEVVNML
jgi:PTS system mannose-specific IIB component